MKKFAEVVRVIADFTVSAALIAVGSAVVVGIVVYLSRHVTCLNLLDKVCFVY